MADAIADARAALTTATAERDRLKTAAGAAAAAAAADPTDVALSRAAAAAADALAAATVAVDTAKVALDATQTAPLVSSTVRPAPPAKPADPVILANIRSDAPPSAAVSGTPNNVVGGVKVDITDSTRRNIAYALVALLAGMVVFQFNRGAELHGVCLIVHNTTGYADIDLTKKLCDVRVAAYNAVGQQTEAIFTAIVGLVGSVVGFYFGQKSSQSPN